MKPTLGHPSRKAAILALHEAGKSPGQIARTLGIAPENASTVISANKKRREGRQGKERRHAVLVDNDVIAALAPHADARFTTIPKLCRAILAAVADDDLVAAVLAET